MNIILIVMKRESRLKGCMIFLNYYVIEEDVNSKYRLYTEEINIGQEEKKAMMLGKVELIPTNPLEIMLKHKFEEEMSDYLSTNFTFVSEKLKNVLKAHTTALFYRAAFLIFKEKKYLYYYISPKKYYCIDYDVTKYEKDEEMPGGIRIVDGFSIKKEMLTNVHIFRVGGLSNRKIVITEYLKNIFELNGIKGINYINVKDYRDINTNINVIDYRDINSSIKMR
jgi:hypothetical protein